MQRPKVLKLGLISQQSIFEKWSAKNKSDGRLPEGLYTESDKIYGPIRGWIFPRFDSWRLGGLSDAMNILNIWDGREEWTELFRAYIEKDQFAKWFLIPILILYDKLCLVYPVLSDLPKPNVVFLKEKKVFDILVQLGAQYKHILDSIFGRAFEKYSLTVSDLELFFSIFGEEATRLPKKEPGSFITKELLFKVTPSESLNYTQAFLKAGLDANEVIDQEYQNTNLHYILALEFSAEAIQWIHLTERLAKEIGHNKPKIQIDYTKQDKYGKTPLILAVGLGLTQVVKLLLSLKKEVGLNIPDHQGRTPIMIAAALGRTEIVSLLLNAGSNLFLKDKSNRDLEWYMKADETEVRVIFDFFSVHPDRASGLTHSWLYDGSSENNVIVRVDEQGVEQPIVLSFVQPHYGILRQVFSTMMSEGPSHAFYNSILNEITSALNKDKRGNKLSEEEFWNLILPFAHGKALNIPSVTQEALQNQLSAQAFILEHQFRVHCALGQVEQVKQMILDNKINIQACDAFKRNALHFCVMRSELVLDCLQKQGYTFSSEEEKAVHVSNCIENHIEIFKLLLDKACDMNQANSNRNTPLSILERDQQQSGVTGQAAKAMLEMYLNKKNGMGIVQKNSGQDLASSQATPISGNANVIFQAEPSSTKDPYQPHHSTSHSL